MRMHRYLLTVLLLIGGAHAPLTVSAAKSCGHTTQSVPLSVQSLLAPLYAGPAAPADLREAHRQLELLMLEAAHCKLSAQSVTGRSDAAEQELVDWHSLDQWLYRLVNFLDLNAKGEKTVDWRAEFETFAEVYELEL